MVVDDTIEGGVECNKYGCGVGNTELQLLLCVSGVSGSNTDCGTACDILLFLGGLLEESKENGDCNISFILADFESKMFCLVWINSLKCWFLYKNCSGIFLVWGVVVVSRYQFIRIYLYITRIL